jgi:hypothetical protein
MSPTEVYGMCSLRVQAAFLLCLLQLSGKAGVSYLCRLEIGGQTVSLLASDADKENLTIHAAAMLQSHKPQSNIDANMQLCRGTLTVSSSSFIIASKQTPDEL